MNLQRQRFGWYMYDWANSAFSTSVVTVFFGPYLTSVAEASPLLGIHPGAFFSYCVSASVLLQVLTMPLIGTLVDATRKRTSLLAVTAYVGAIATALLFFISAEAQNALLGGLLFILANVAFGSSIVVSNSFLPDLAQPQERDRISSRGWAVGYLGGGLLLLGHLMYFQDIESAGGSIGLAVRTILASVGVWWGLFTIIPLRWLPRQSQPALLAPPITVASTFRQFRYTLQSIRAVPATLTFFVAYLLYNDTIQTVIALASVYGQQELGLSMSVLTKAILLVQFVAIGGSLLFERIASLIGTKQAIVMSLVGWAAVLLAAYGAVSTEWHFYVLAAAIALVLGGTQALSRSMFSTMIPPGKEGEYFALYEISDKGTSWLGPLAFGVALSLTGSYRLALLSLIIFLVAGMILLLRVKISADSHGN